MTLSTEQQTEHLLEIRNIVKHFPITRGVFIKRQIGAVHALNGIDLTINPGETVGLVGESGCGKTTLGKIVLRLVPPTSGRVLFHGMDIYSEKADQSLGFNGKVNTVFQDPYSSLDPRMNVFNIISEPLLIKKEISRAQRRERVLELLDLIGLSANQLNRYPHEFSGGQRQRIAVARALALDPELVIADEPTSALDVSIQAQIINMLQDLQERFNLAYLLISHDLNLVYHISHRIGVMYLGKMMEMAAAEKIYRNPMHPYTQALISSIPSSNPDERRTPILLHGTVQSPVNLPQGCIFSQRCFKASSECLEKEPDFINIGDENDPHYVACLKHGA